MNANATEAAIAVNIVMVKACANMGEKVLSAYIFVSIRFNWLLGVSDWLVIGSARLFSLSLCSSVVNRNEWGIASSRRWVHYRHEKKRCQVFF